MTFCHIIIIVHLSSSTLWKCTVLAVLSGIFGCTIFILNNVGISGKMCSLYMYSEGETGCTSEEDSEDINFVYMVRFM